MRLRRYRSQNRVRVRVPESRISTIYFYGGTRNRIAHQCGSGTTTVDGVDASPPVPAGKIDMCSVSAFGSNTQPSMRASPPAPTGMDATMMPFDAGNCAVD